MARISKPGLDYFPARCQLLPRQEGTPHFQPSSCSRNCRTHFPALPHLQRKGILCRMESRYLVRHFAGSVLRGGGDAAIIDDCLSVGLFDTYIYKEYGILTSQAIQEQYHKIITDSRRKYKLPLEQFWLIKEGEDGTENNSAEIRNNINSKGTEVYEAESHIVGAEVNAIKTRNQYHSYRVTKTKTGIGTTGSKYPCSRHRNQCYKNSDRRSSYEN